MSFEDTIERVGDAIINLVESKSGGGGTVDQTYDSTSANAQSGVAIAGAKFLQNTATGSNALTIAGTATTKTGATNVGKSSAASGTYSSAFGNGSTASGDRSLAIGRSASASGDYSVTFGAGAIATANYAIQIGYGTNSTASTLSIGFSASSSANRKNWQLLDGVTGKIPNERINIDTTPTSGSSNAITSGAVYTALGDIETLINAL